MVAYGDRVFRTFWEGLRDHFRWLLELCRKTHVFRHRGLAGWIGL